MDVTKNVAKYLNEKGINLSVLAKKTGISYPALYSSLSLKSKTNRELRAGELLRICNFLNLNPMIFIDLKKMKSSDIETA